MFTLIKKSLMERKYLYACFVDFRKAFDSMSRQRLIYKLQEFWLTGDILEIIKTMYATPNVSLLAQKYDLNKVICSVLFPSTFI